MTRKPPQRGSDGNHGGTPAWVSFGMILWILGLIATVVYLLGGF